mgnify:CR=1 FL=1
MEEMRMHRAISSKSTIIFKKYLDNIENCTTARAYPDLLNVLIISFRVSRGLHKLSIIIVMNLETKIHLREA